MSKNLLKSKSAYTKRRLIMVFILCTVIAVSLMTGFSGLSSDNTKHSAIGQRICMYDDVPEDGTTPADHDLVSNVKYTAQRLYMSRYFRGETVGKVEAELGAGLSYNQDVYNTRVVKGEKIFTQSISSSWAKSVAEQKYIDGTRVLYRPATSVSGKTAKFANSARDITDKFGELYGLIPNELTKQVLSVTEDPDKDYGVTIKSVRDDNANQKHATLSQTSRNDAAVGGATEVITFDVPQTLVPDGDGNYQFTLTLDPVSATLYSRNETRTLAGSAQNPDYSSASNGSVVVTIKIDENWYPISVRVRETYGIEIKGIGALICNSTLTETFSEIGNRDIVLPEQEFFESHMDDIGGDVLPAEPGAADYLQYAFGKYISGAENLDLSANIAVGDINIKNLKLSLNIGTMNVRARYGDLYVEYGKGDAVGRADDVLYITLNDIKGYLPVEKATGLISDPSVKALLSLFASDIQLPDFGSLFGEDFMSGMTLEKTDKYAIIHIPLELEGLAKVDAQMKLKASEPYDLVSISGTVDAFGRRITLDAKPAKNLVFETPDKSYADLSPVIDLVPAAISTVLDNDAYGIKGDITLNGNTVSLDAYIARDGFESLSAVDATVSLFGQNLSVKYVNDAIYASVGKVGVKANAEDIPALIEELKRYINLDAGLLDKIKALLPATIDDWISTAKSLEADESGITLGLRILGAPVTLKISRNGNALTGLALDFSLDIFDVKLDAALDFDITAPSRREVAPLDIDYIDAKELPGLIPFILGYANADALDIEINGKATVGGADILLDGRIGAALANGQLGAALKITALDQTLDATYSDGVAYVSVGNIKFKFDTADAAAFKPAAEKLLKALGINISAILPAAPDLSNIDITAVIPAVLAAVEKVSVENGVITLTAIINDNRIILAADVENGTITVDGEIRGVKLDIDCTVTARTPDEVKITVEHPETYSDAKEFIPTIDKLADVIAAKALSARFDVQYGEYNFGGTFAIDLNGGLDGIKLRLALDTLVGDNVPAVTAQITIIGKTAYIVADGGIDAKLCASLDDMRAACEKLKSVLPEKVYAAIIPALEIAGDLDGALKDMLIGAKPPALEDIRTMLDGILSAVTLRAADKNIEMNISLLPITGKNVTITANAATDLSSLGIKAEAGQTSVDARLYDITSDADIATPDGEFVSVADVLPLVDAVMPLADMKGLKLGLTATVFGVDVSGDITLALPSQNAGLSAEISLTVGDLPISIVYAAGKIYVDVNNGDIMLSCGTDKAELNALLGKLAEAVPQLGDVINIGSSAIADILASPEKLLSSRISLEKTSVGFNAKIDLAPVGIDASATLGIINTDGKFAGLSIEAVYAKDTENDITLDLNFDAELDESGALKAIRATDGTTFAARLEIQSKNAQQVSVNGNGYIALADLVDYALPVMSLVNTATTAESLSLGINAYVLTDDNKRLSITGKAEIDFNPLSVRASIELLGDKIDITYVGGTLYIKLGTIELKFALDGSDGANDIARIHAILAEHLPAYLSEELAILLGLEEGLSSLSDIGLIIDRFSSLGSADTIESKAALLFGKLHDYDGAPSAVKALADMLQLYMKGKTPVIGFEAAENLTVTIAPFLSADKTALSELVIETEISGMAVHAAIGTPTFSDTAFGITAPENNGNYVSLLDYIELINNIVHTFTTTDNDGNITFEIDKFDFNYKEKDTVVQNADGTSTTVAGKTISATAVKNGETALPVLKGIFAKNAKGGYDVNLEAHVKLSGISENTGDITLALYVLTNYTDASSGKLYDKVAFLSYTESKTGYGENVSIDYGSVMQILASVLKILGVNDVTIDTIIPAEYRVEIDSEIFRSMEIVGMDGVRDTINNLVALLINAKAALGDLGEAWNLVKAPDAMADATREQKIDALLGSMEQIKALLKQAAARFGKTETTQNPDKTEITEITVDKFSDIVNGIALTSENGKLGATVSNKLTTDGNGVAKILVSQDVNAHGKGILDGFTVSNLDVNTAVIDNIDVSFTAGGNVVIAPDISALENVTDGKDKTTYSDFSNVKHLLFDVLNTANLMEFAIGGVDTSDTITLNLHLGSLNLADVPIHYDVKVKLFDKAERVALGLLSPEQAQNKNEPQFKTAAFVELKFKDCTAFGMQVVGDLSTRLYFYDDILYLDGVKSWASKELSYGGFLGIGATKKTFFECERVYVKYTVEQFMKMMSSDMEKFMYEFLFYLVPLSRDLSVAHLDIQKIIADAVKPKEGETTTATPTIATVFKGYHYADGAHTLTIGLNELAGNSSLSDVTVSFVGANNDNGNLLDNYVSSAAISTSFAGVADLSLNATLRNAKVDESTQTLVSTGLGGVTVYNDHWYLENKQFIFDGKNVEYASLADVLKGELPITGNNANPWTNAIV